MPGLARLRFWAWPAELRRRGVLGINRRNLELIAPLNPRRLVALVDDKARTKRLCEAHRIPVPETYALLERFGDVRRLGDILAGRDEFVIKPACGAAGRGVLVVAGRRGDAFRRPDGRTCFLADIRYHVSTVLSGLHSLGGRPDKAIVEQRIACHPAMAGLAAGGTPDIRVIAHRARPVLAMLRLPTRSSGGRANLHQGAVGVGVDLATGRTTRAMHRGRRVATHPDTGAALAGVTLPHWSDTLITAASLSRAIGLGYLGVDIVLDAARGPIVLEANARPGLAVQLANGAGLLHAIAPAAPHEGARGRYRGAGLSRPRPTAT